MGIEKGKEWVCAIYGHQQSLAKTGREYCQLVDRVKRSIGSSDKSMDEWIARGYSIKTGKQLSIDVD